MPEETPEQVMARLARYADSLRRAPGGPIDPTRRQIAKPGAIRTLPPRSALRAAAAHAPGGSSSTTATASPWSRPPAASVGHFAGVAAPPLAYPPQPAAFPVPPVQPVQPGPPAPPTANRFVFAPPRFTDVRMTVAGQLLSAAGCAGAVLAFVFLSTLAASVLVVAVVAAGVVAIKSHWSLAWWWTLGVLAGGLLGRFS